MRKWALTMGLPLFKVNSDKPPKNPKNNQKRMESHKIKEDQTKNKIPRSLFLGIRKMIIAFHPREFFSSVTLRKMIIVIILIGIFLRIFTLYNINAGSDASYYIILGKSYAERGEPFLPFGDIETDSLEPTHSTSTRQAFPLYLSAFYFIFGFSYLITKIAAIVLSLITLLVVYLTTKNLFGRDNALVVTGIVSVSYVLITMTGIVYSENLIFLFLVIGLWGFLKQDKYFPIGMVSMSLFYISRSYSLILYILLVCLLYCWLYYVKRKEILNRYYIIALISTIPFAILLYLSSIHYNYPVRNISIMDAIINDPQSIFLGYLRWLFLAFVFTLIFAVYFIKPLRESLSTRNLLWMVIAVLLLGIPLFMSYQNYVYTDYHPDVREQVRKILYIILPLLWLAIPNLKLDLDEKLRLQEIWKNLKNLNEHKRNIGLIGFMCLSIALTFVFLPSFWLWFPLIVGMISILFNKSKWKIAILVFMLLLISIEFGTMTSYEFNRRLGEDINNEIEDGDVIMFDGIAWVKTNNDRGLDRYFLAPYVTKDYRIVNFDSNETPDYIITKNNSIIYENYTVLKEYYNHDKRGIFLEMFYDLRETLINPEEVEKKPAYILWGRE